MSADLDAVDLRILAQLQRDAALSNQELAQRVHVSPATCLRRVRRLTELRIIERTVAVLSPDHLGTGLTAILEVSLEQQSSELLEEFETRVQAESVVQQCYRVSSGPDFVLIVLVANMEAYHAFAHRVFSSQARVRNVRAFFSIKRSKFDMQVPLPPLPTAKA